MWLNHMTKSHLNAKWFKLAIEKAILRRQMPWSHFCADDASRCLGQTPQSYLHPLLVSRKQSCFTDKFRYCPECIQLGFHASIFTMQAVKGCPFHHVELIDGCTICRSWHVNEDRSRTVRPFCCLSCGGNIFRYICIESSIFAGCPKLVDAFTDARLLLNRLGEGRILVSPEPGHFGNRHEAIQLLDATWKSVYGAQDKPPWLASSVFKTSSWRYPGPLPNLQSKRQGPPPAPGVDSEVRLTKIHISNVLVNATRVLRSIDKQISRLVYSICGHRRHENPKIYLGGQGSQTFEFQSFSGGECPSCAILGCWRAHVGALFAFKVFLEEAGNVGWRGDKWAGWSFSGLNQENILAVRLISCFARLAIVVSAHMNRSLAHSIAALEVFPDRPLNQHMKNSGSHEFEIRHSDFLDAIWKTEFRSVQLFHFLGLDSARICLADVQTQWTRCEPMPKFAYESRAPNALSNSKWRIPETLSICRTSWARGIAAQ
jgi:hypothetical protein